MSHISILNTSARERIKKFDRYHQKDGSFRNTPKVRAVDNQFRPINQSRNTSIIHKEPINYNFRQSFQHVKDSVSGFRKTEQKVPSAGSIFAIEAVAGSVFSREYLEQSYEGLLTVSRKSLSVIQKMFYIAGLVAFLVAIGVSGQTMLFNKNAKQLVQEKVKVLGEQTQQNTVDKEGVQQGTGENPSSDKPIAKSIANYRVPAQNPRYIRIPSINIYSRIKPLGTKNGAVDAPSNVFDTGWFDQSVLPGSKKGVSLLLGHVSSWEDNGVFKYIKDLKPGDAIEVEKGNGEKVSYKVDSLQNILVADLDMSKVLYEVPTGQHSLRLITCNGSYDRNTQEYLSRMIVYASPI